MKFRSAVKLNIVAQALALVASVGFVLLASRWLGPVGRGQQALAVTTAQLVVLALGVGVAASAPAYLRGDTGRLPGLMRLLWGTFVLEAVGLLLLALAIRSHLILPQLVGLEWQTVLLGMSSYLRDMALAVAFALRRQRTAAFVSLAPAVLTILAFLALSPPQRNPAMALWCQIVGFAVGGVMLFRVVRTSATAEPSAREEFPVWWRPALQGYGSTLFALAMLRTDLYAVSAFLGPASTGIYSVAQSCAELVLKVPSWIAMVLTPFVAATKGNAVPRTIRLTRATIAAALLGACFAWAFASPISKLLVAAAGAEYAPVYSVMLVMLPRVIIQSGIAFLAGHLAGQGYTKWHPWSTFVGFISVAIFCLLLVPTGGMKGAAVATDLSIVPVALILAVGFARTNGLAVRDLATRLVTGKQERAAAIDQ
jgi:O-antigen/teichoic acid export membrane protein